MSAIVQPTTQPEINGFDPYKITRPAPILMQYYFLASLLAGPMFVVPLLPLWFKYLTLRYKFDDKGISMSWGIIFKKEVLLTYRRIQDIHLTRNIVQRWMGLANLGVQTAAGSSSAEMTIEGVLEAEPLRDFLYSKMRGARGLDDPAGEHAFHPAGTGMDAGASKGATASAGGDEALGLLQEIRDSLARLAERPG